ncbi:MBL fold metallo-hydrolase [Pseudomonas aeruginosa]|uniref:MBL fold metallo-hydrolase n=1 Tax=Pseudomonas aeruginosa TaxID=287 RepID=UPI000691E8B2|nr:MBL fold metallo-hydrolase [Pseudomonas aeruginosa]
MIRIDFSQLHQAREDAAAAMPSIAGKKILMGFWHNWPAGAADGYQQGSFANIALEDVPSEYNVVAVAFMKGRGIPTFQPYNLSDAEFRRQVGVLNAQGRAVLISLGGADAHIELHAGQEQALAAEIVRLVETYGFDGLDIDLEQSAIDLADNQRVLPAALKLVREHYAGQGKHFIVSMAPEFPYLHKNGKYVPYLQALEGVYDFIAPQYYNQGGDRLLAWGVPPGKVRQLDWWQGIEAGGLRLTATPAQHFSGRGLHDGNRTLWCSWVIESAELKLFFSGDSGYFDGFAEIGRRYGPFDLTMLETGAYNEHWPYVHMHPQQTLQAHRDLGGRWLLPIHNGTFDLAMHAWYEPFERILELATEHGVRVSTPMMGERIDLQAPHAGRRWWREVVDSETQVQGYGCCRS